MRDEKRIKRILNLLEEIWNKHSDERLGQLLINIGIAEDTMPLWSIEDDDMEKGLNKVLKSLK